MDNILSKHDWIEGCMVKRIRQIHFSLSFSIIHQSLKPLWTKNNALWKIFNELENFPKLKTESKLQVILIKRPRFNYIVRKKTIVYFLVFVKNLDKNM